MASSSCPGKNNIPYRVISDYEFHSSYTPKENEITIFHAHSEYWSEQMKNNLDMHYKNGRALFFFSGNSIYRDVKPYARGINVISQESSRRRTETLIGTFFDTKGVNTYSSYRVSNRNHWIFENLPEEVKTFGQGDTSNTYDGASGFETDKIGEYSSATLLAKGGESIQRWC